MCVLITFRSDPDVHSIGKHAKGNWLHGNRRHLLARQFEMGLQQEIANVLELGGLNHR